MCLRSHIICAYSEGEAKTRAPDTWGWAERGSFPFGGCRAGQRALGSVPSLRRCDEANIGRNAPSGSGIASYRAGKWTDKLVVSCRTLLDSP